MKCELLGKPFHEIFLARPPPILIANCPILFTQTNYPQRYSDKRSGLLANLTYIHVTHALFESQKTLLTVVTLTLGVTLLF